MSYACIILAAGQSKRMARSKIVLPWGDKTVIGTIISAFEQAGVKKIVVVTGGYREEVEREITKFNVTSIFNPNFKNGEMSFSLQKGLDEITNEFDGTFVALGDQPDIHPTDIQGLIETGVSHKNSLIIPSYQMRRGHPWLVPSFLFEEIKNIHAPETMRDFIQKHEKDIVYYLVRNSNILADLDTPEDYERLRPK